MFSKKFKINQEALKKKVNWVSEKIIQFSNSKFPTLCICNIKKTECYPAQSCLLLMPMLCCILFEIFQCKVDACANIAALFLSVTCP